MSCNDVTLLGNLASDCQVYNGVTKITIVTKRGYDREREREMTALVPVTFFHLSSAQQEILKKGKQVFVKAQVGLSHQCSDAWHQCSDAWHQCSDAWHQCSDVWHQCSDVWHQCSDAWHQWHDAWHQWHHCKLFFAPMPGTNAPTPGTNGTNDAWNQCSDFPGTNALILNQCSDFTPMLRRLAPMMILHQCSDAWHQ